MHSAERKIADTQGFRSDGRSVRPSLTSRLIPNRAWLRAFVLGFGDDPVFDRADFVDLASDGIADDQRPRRLEREADAARRSRENNVTRLERHGLRELGDLLPDVEDQVPGIRVLAKLAVDKGAQPQDVRVADLVSRDDARAKGTVRIE